MSASVMQGSHKKKKREPAQCIVGAMDMPFKMQVFVY